MKKQKVLFLMTLLTSGFAHGHSYGMFGLNWLKGKFFGTESIHGSSLGSDSETENEHRKLMERLGGYLKSGQRDGAKFNLKRMDEDLKKIQEKIDSVTKNRGSAMAQNST